VGESLRRVGGGGVGRAGESLFLSWDLGRFFLGHVMYNITLRYKSFTCKA
jgi:hypothetical protein